MKHLLIWTLGLAACAACGRVDDRTLEQYTYAYDGYNYACMREYETQIGPLYCFRRVRANERGLAEYCPDTLPWLWDIKVEAGKCP
jgi:hypothetical protein